MKTPKICAVHDCGRKHLAKGYCAAHYQRVHNGNLNPSRPVTKSKFGSENGRWKGGQTHDGHGRVMILKPDHPNANAWGYVYRYRLIVERQLGRFLQPWEIIHHKDGDCSNDHIENLEVMTQSEHARIHVPDMHNEVWMEKQLSMPRDKEGRFT